MATIVVLYVYPDGDLMCDEWAFPKHKMAVEESGSAVVIYGSKDVVAVYPIAHLVSACVEHPEIKTV